MLYGFFYIYNCQRRDYNKGSFIDIFLIEFSMGIE